MNEIKILLSINLNGVFGSPSKEREIIPYNIVTNLEEKEVVKTGIMYHSKREILPCTKKIQICEEVYRFWTDYKEVPKQIDAFMWKKYSNSQKVRFHCAQLAEGNSFSFEIIE
jgi:hypothetical protein